MPDAVSPRSPVGVGRILVADDEEALRHVMAEMLQEEGHTVIQASNGLEAVERATDSNPDVLVTDLMMPRLDGFEVCRRLKANPATASIVILMLTGIADRDVRLTGIEAGANDFLTKPPDRSDMVLRVRNAVILKRLLGRQRTGLSPEHAAALEEVLAALRGLRELMNDRPEDAGYQAGREELDSAILRLGQVIGQS